MGKLINAIGFQIGWWACIAGVRLGLEIETIVLCLCWIAVQLWLSTSRSQDIQLGAAALLVGICADSLLQYFSVIDFYGWSLGLLSPFWLWLLWIMFALTLNSSLDFLKKWPLIPVSLLGLFLGPLTYVAGAKLGAAQLDVSPRSLLSLAGVWMIALPLLVFIATQPPQTPEGHTT